MATASSGKTKVASSGKTKVLLVEINEITWRLIDPWIEQGKLPAFARLKREGAWGAPMSVDLPPQLDPWITWTTLYTGRTQQEHNVYFLQQPPESIHAKRLWEICDSHGLSVGVYGSVCSWPPQKVKGYYVPDTFSPDSATYPDELGAIQDLNLTYTRSIRLPSDQDGLMFKLKLGAKLIKLGLQPSTMSMIAGQLLAERVAPKKRWMRVALQPFVNFDFFSGLYRRYQPDFATFHSNHVAHYMHTYWKAMEPHLFDQPTSKEEIETYGGAIEFGYRKADDLLAKILNLIGPDTVLAVASSMGQQPYLSDLKDGKAINQLRSLEQLMEVLGLKGQVRAIFAMSGQFNIYADSEAIKNLAEKRLRDAYIDTPERPMFAVKSVDQALTATLKRYDEIAPSSRCFFPVDGQTTPHPYSQLVHNTGMVKSGYHHPEGILMLYGNGIRPGVHIAGSNNLDIAPTLLSLLGLPVPAEMKGRVLQEALTYPRFAMSAS